MRLNNLKDQIGSRKNLVVFIVLIIIFIIKLIAVLNFNNKDWEPDSYMHFLELRTVFNNFPHNIHVGLGVWSKPLYTYFLGFIVYLFNIDKLIYVQIVNIIIFLIIAYLVYRIVNKLYSNFYLSLLSIFLISFSLTLFKSSTSTLTDAIFTLTLTLGFYFIIFEKIELSSLFFGISILGRIEALYFISIYLLWLVYKTFKDKKALVINFVITLLPLIVWNFIGYLRTKNILYILKSGYPTTPGIYGYGGWLHYPKLFITKEFLITLLFGIGVAILIKNILKSKNITKDFKIEKSFAIVIIIGFILIQIVLWKYGLFATAGLMRYFVSVIPFMVIIACEALVVVFNLKISSYNSLIFFIGFAQLSFVFIAFSGIINSIKDYPDVDKELIDSGVWVKKNITAKTFVGADRPEMIYYAGRDLTNTTDFYKDQINKSKPGIYLWNGWSDITQKEISSKASLLTIIDDKVFVYIIN